MSKSALGIVFSLLFCIFTLSEAAAAGSSGTVAKKKAAPKKAIIVKKKAAPKKAIIAKKKAAPKKAIIAKKKTAPKKAVTAKKKTSVATAKRKSSARKKVATKPVGKASSRKASDKKVVITNDKQGAGIQRAAFTSGQARSSSSSSEEAAELYLSQHAPALRSSVVLVLDQSTSDVLLEKNAHVAMPIASITKLMTSLVVIESGQDMNEILTVTEEDIDREKNTYSRLRIGSQLTRANMLHIALMSSENRAASALGRHYPGGLPAFVSAMNAKAAALGMTNTRFVEPTGLSSLNVASARDLVKLVVASSEHPLIRQYSTDMKYSVDTGGPILHYRTSNRLILNPEWDIGLQKTGYISEAGRCLVMQATIEGRPIVMIFLDAKGKMTRSADAVRIRKWLETAKPAVSSRTASASAG
jgi:D-alanyl-D-alanine endopeptidase (penicillin-binding protein 7)